jgi:hypothetical protein
MVGNSRRVKRPAASQIVVPKKPYYFVSFSGGEPLVGVFMQYLDLVFHEHFTLMKTPASLTPGQGQHDTITELIERCEFGIVCLDGLRPNVVYEYGIMLGAKKVALLFREEASTVDIGHFIDKGTVQQDKALPPPPIDLDKHFSNAKDKFCQSWNQFKFVETIRTIWESYEKIKPETKLRIDVPKPKICT